MHAYSDVRSVLNSLGKEVEIKARSQANVVELAKGCFISLGGPLANGVSEYVLIRLGQRLPVKFLIDEKCFEFEGAKFSASYDINQLVERDYGLVIRLQKLDPADITSKPVLVAFGLHGHGTQQIVKAILTDENLASQFKPFLSGDFYALMKFEFNNHEVTRKSVISVEKIRC
ncbi:hypothetical protein [Methylobacterium sp. Leaf111]|uniref:hypothetical protein n=1 Tax=Methylobacterium sp. Leaf111 TaxID=1736257 RepID=UPI001AEC053E|nr:hypothetical protein [Methylobacterium sp. Leaf111]